VGWDREEELHWLALLLVPGLGARRGRQLVEQARSIRALFRASRADLEGLGLPGSQAQSIVSGCTFEGAAVQQEKLGRSGARLVDVQSPLYPPLLKQIYDPPLALFCRGNLDLLTAVQIAIVGTRRPSPYGSAVAEKFGAELAAAGVAITSGMARGIDTGAHKGALAAGGGTVAVFGCGLDHVYPSENRKLAEDISAKGLIVSEFPFGTPAYPQNFPVRNRIIAGLSAGVLMVEGAQYSGSAITAKLALEYGREVFAVPGNITSRMSWAPNLMIKQGAKLVQDWNDVLAELSAEDRRRLPAHGGIQLNLMDERPQPAATATARTILGILPRDQPLQFDELCDRLTCAATGGARSSSEVIAALFELELAGLIRQLPGKRYLRAWT
jgi:DNA processing protein